ncbi:AcrR family transcriptional regulator [Actinoplanes octamycinicus]|uniref:AcrR family transcriptional regulator n=1 Tax=Actinoplanes octamycinicus TaxID=135948 RepID=A0A7W7GWF0_9ACTN|nr:TetR/AcrR family transcriptional regulator [Actinoplanes octamycinicus]MBB4739553.1 AcrR family transcriptional regulator [Actinoplanes octamycinicus]GIE54734.1 TetR family transcriptional regulator [Actinoplanes octamycinicus]
MSRQPTSNRRSEQSRQAILTAAAGLCAEVGYAATTVEGIAARAGVGKQTIYRWWPSKAAVLLEHMERVREAQAGFPDTGDLRADLLAQTSAVQALFGGDLGAVWRGLLIAAQSEDVAAAGVRALLEQAISDAKERLARAREAGELRPDADLDMAVEIIYGPLYHAWLLRARPLPEAYMKEVLALVFEGLAG